MSDGRDVQISTPGGASFNANQYVVQRGDDDRQIMIYWYQGRGRAVASEYKDKMYTIVDIITTGRSDGSMIRVITPVYSDETDSEAAEAAKEFAASIYAAVTPFVPE
jgi:EpsI family protein